MKNYQLIPICLLIGTLTGAAFVLGVNFRSTRIAPQGMSQHPKVITLPEEIEAAEVGDIIWVTGVTQDSIHLGYMLNKKELDELNNK